LDEGADGEESVDIGFICGWVGESEEEDRSGGYSGGVEEVYIPRRYIKHAETREKATEREETFCSPEEVSWCYWITETVGSRGKGFKLVYWSVIGMVHVFFLNNYP